MCETNSSENLNHVIVQVRLPAKDINESVEWYERNFGFKHLWKTDQEADMKLEPGPFLFLKKAEPFTPLHIVAEGKPLALLSIKTSSIMECHRRFVEAGEEVTEITNTWGIEQLFEFTIKDPAGNLIHVGNYPGLDD